MATPPSPHAEEDYSPSATVVPFARPVPLLRVPVPAGPPDDPSTGPFLLAFKDPQSFQSAFNSCESKIVEQCDAGARIGCAIKASTNCKPPWWRAMIGGAMDLKERERCEEREMAICVAAAKEKCVEFAKEKCLPPFRDARIALKDPKMAEGSGLWNLASCGVGATNYRGSALLDSRVL